MRNALIDAPFRRKTAHVPPPIIPDLVIPIVTPHRNARLCLTQSGWRNWGQFAADVAELRPRIAEYSVLCNLTGSRYAFMVGLAAALLNGQRTLLPSSAAPENVRRTIAQCDDVLILGAGIPALSGPRLIDVPAGQTSLDPVDLLDKLTQATGEIHVHTSGSTGDPTPHVKTFGALAGGSNLTENLFAQSGLDTTPGALTIIGTTPYQHMFGLEAAVTTPLAYGHPVINQTPMLPGDLEQILGQGRESGCGEYALVTSPAHLKFLEPVIMASPEIRTILSATAPMPVALAERLEARGDLAVMEIYGSTETGSLAGRRTVQGPEWTPMNGFSLTPGEDNEWMATAPHLRRPEVLADALEMSEDGRFRLLGRLGEMVTVAGKRNNLGALNAALAEAPGIRSGCYLILQDALGRETQLGIVVVPHAADADPINVKRGVRDHMRTLVDPVFVPRQIVLTDLIERDATGKITATEQARLIQQFT